MATVLTFFIANPMINYHTLQGNRYFSYYPPVHKSIKLKLLPLDYVPIETSSKNENWYFAS